MVEVDRESLLVGIRAVDERLRLAGPGDGAALARMVRSLATTEWGSVPRDLEGNLARHLRDPGPSFTVLAGDPPVGFAIVHLMPAPAEGSVQLCIDDVYVEPEARRAGLGRAMVDAVRMAAHVLGACYVYLLVRPDNEQARRLYEAAGLEAADDVLYEWYRP